ncbi:MAG: UDP-glucose 4-epimerase GalE [Alphaproteobacteria bacterium]
MTKVLVAGGAGYIGSHVAKELLDNGLEVRVFDNLSTGDKINLFEKAEFVEGDIKNYQQISNAMKGVDAVVFLAGKKAVGESMEKPEIYSENNIAGAINVLNAMIENNVKNIVFSSSAAVYGMPEYVPLDESHPTKPINFYGYTKMFFENTMDWYNITKNINYVSLRYFNAVGYDATGAIKGRERNPQNLLPIISEVVNGTREKLMVFGSDYNTPDGTCVRDYIHTSDLASAHFKAIIYLLNGGSSEIVNLGTGVGTSVKEIIQATEEIIKKPLNVEYTNRRAGDPEFLTASNAKAKAVLNWEPKYTNIKDIIKTNL